MLLCCASLGPSTSIAATGANSAPLKEIGRVHAKTAFCQDVFDRGGPATSAALLNDGDLEGTASYLGRVELDDNKLAKPSAIAELQKRYALLMARASTAVAETKALRVLADAAPTPEQKTALIDYSNALGGALHRQMLTAEYYRRFVMYLEVHEPVAWQDRNRALFYAARTPPGPTEHGGDPRDRVPPPLTEVARAESDQVTQRHAKAVEDELRAAQAVDRAFGPCTPSAP